VVAIARPHLAELAAAIGEAAGLSIPERDAMHYVEQVDSDHPVGVRDWTGARIPMHAVSSGLAVLALWPRARSDQYLSAPLERFTDRTMTDPAQLRTRLQRIQIEGQAWTNGEYAEGIASVAAAIADADGEIVAAVHVHGPSYRFPPAGRDAALGAQVVTAATRITRALRQGAG
jgi:DNA-binding IclR family transcriptional regulator